jgi:hypothetical protein
MIVLPAGISNLLQRIFISMWDVPFTISQLRESQTLTARLLSLRVTRTTTTVLFV